MSRTLLELQRLILKGSGLQQALVHPDADLGKESLHRYGYRHSGRQHAVLAAARHRNAGVLQPRRPKIEDETGQTGGRLRRSQRRAVIGKHIEVKGLATGKLYCARFRSTEIRSGQRTAVSVHKQIDISHPALVRREVRACSVGESIQIQRNSYSAATLILNVLRACHPDRSDNKQQGEVFQFKQVHHFTFT